MNQLPMRLFIIFLVAFTSVQIHAQDIFSISPAELQNKIKGGWAGQTIGVTYGAPVEFKFQGSMINQYQKLKWYDGLLKKSMMEAPGIYDDLYMDITFVEVFDQEGLDAPVSSHAKAIANAGYMLWHANQAARYNLLHGMHAPQSGIWQNNPHADCIDFQIEADFAGLMSPLMTNTSSAICNKIGHIMNYGDGYYGGVYVSAMYTLAFGSKDIHYIVKEALKAIPKNTTYHACISDVIKWHKQYPNDWTFTWLEIQKKWTDDIGCPGGVFHPFNIDATVNSAYVVMGLLYGNGDFTKTMEIATRAGQDADCNPSTAAGILGTLLGYDNIPSYWKMGLSEVEDINFKYTNTSLRRVYELSYKQALDNIQKNGGTISHDHIVIKKQPIQPVEWEQSFIDIFPYERPWIGKELTNEFEFEFKGNAFVITGEYKPKTGSVFDENISKVADIEMYIDGIKTETIKLPMSFTTRRHEIAWKYEMEDRQHNVKLKILNPDGNAICFITDMIWYSKKNRKQALLIPEKSRKQNRY